MKITLTVMFKKKTIMDKLRSVDDVIVVKFYEDDVLVYERELSKDEALSYMLYPYGDPVRDEDGIWHYVDSLTITGNSNTDDGMHLLTVIDNLKKNIITPPQVKRWINPS